MALQVKNGAARRPNSGVALLGGVVPSNETAKRVQSLLTRVGANVLARAFKCAPNTLVRVAAKQRVRKGSLVLVESELDDVERSFETLDSAFPPPLAG